MRSRPEGLHSHNAADTQRAFGYIIRDGVFVIQIVMDEQMLDELVTSDPRRVRFRLKEGKDRESTTLRPL